MVVNEGIELRISTSRAIPDGSGGMIVKFTKAPWIVNEWLHRVKGNGDLA